MNSTYSKCTKTGHPKTQNRALVSGFQTFLASLDHFVNLKNLSLYKTVQAGRNCLKTGLQLPGVRKLDFPDSDIICISEQV